MEITLAVLGDVRRYPNYQLSFEHSFSLMSLPKHNRRNAQVDGYHFHWVKGCRGVVTVQLATGNGSKLMVEPYGTIRSEHVADAIRFALTNGWQPNEHGLIRIGFADHTSQSRFVSRNAADPPYWTEFDSDYTNPKYRIKFLKTEGLWKFDICCFTQEMTRWFNIYRCNSKGCVQFFCANLANLETETSEEELCRKLVAASKRAADYGDILNCFVTLDDRWAYWGSGMPNPVADFYRFEVAPIIQRRSD